MERSWFPQHVSTLFKVINTDLSFQTGEPSIIPLIHLQLIAKDFFSQGFV